MFGISSKSKQEAYIKELEEDIDQAHEAGVDAAKTILREQESAEKEELVRLRDLGFKNEKSVTRKFSAFNDIDNMVSSAEELDKLVHKYPDRKFMTGAQLVEICKKYGLVYGNAEHYIGEIPMENRKNIINHNIQRRDISYTIIVAPRKEFDKKLEIDISGKLFVRPPKPINFDPVVLFKMRVHCNADIYVVVDKWGPEAKIKEFEK